MKSVNVTRGAVFWARICDKWTFGIFNRTYYTITVYIVTNEQCYCKIYLMIYLIADLVIPFNVILL